VGVPERPIVVDGHKHVVNRGYWEGIDPWRPQSFGFARARARGVDVVVENVAPYGFRTFDGAARQTLCLLEAAFRPWDEPLVAGGNWLQAPETEQACCDLPCLVMLIR
jgi:hypothetical protein